MRFWEEVNAYLEQLNAAKCHKDPFLVAFTLTTDEIYRTHITAAFGLANLDSGRDSSSYPIPNSCQAVLD